MNKRTCVGLAIAIVAGPLIHLAMAVPSRAGAPPDEQVSFKEDVLHIFSRHCGTCHAPGGEGYSKSGLLLTTYAGVMKGTTFGPMVVPGDPTASNLLRLIDWSASPKLRMPHEGHELSVGDREMIRTWIRQGAKDN